MSRCLSKLIIHSPLIKLTHPLCSHLFLVSFPLNLRRDHAKNMTLAINEPEGQIVGKKRRHKTCNKFLSVRESPILKGTLNFPLTFRFLSPPRSRTVDAKLTNFLALGRIEEKRSLQPRRRSRRCISNSSTLQSLNELQPSRVHSPCTPFDEISSDIIYHNYK